MLCKQKVAILDGKKSPNIFKQRMMYTPKARNSPLKENPTRAKQPIKIKNCYSILEIEKNPTDNEDIKAESQK